VATQRAYIMLAIFFLAVLLDRPAITMRNVLWAALLVLLWQPHAVLQAGFQMSFSAVMALVAVYEAWRQRDTLHLRWERLSLAQQMMRSWWSCANAANNMSSTDWRAIMALCPKPCHVVRLAVWFCKMM
jgi:competence protein ComEC